MNFSGLKTSFYLTFLTSALIDLTGILTQVSQTGGGNASSIYLICQTLIFAFVLRSIFIGILYDIIVNKVDEAISEGQLVAHKPELDSSYVRTSKNSPSPIRRTFRVSSFQSGSKLNFSEPVDIMTSPALVSEGTPQKSQGSPITFSTLVKHAMQMNKIEIAEKNKYSSFRKFLVDKYHVT
jgi:hypothetical protein